MNTLPSIDLVATGNMIKKLRKEKKYKVEQISDYLGFTGPQAIYKWQRGECLPEITNLLALSRLFGVTIEDILVEREEADEASSFCLCRLVMWTAYLYE